MARFSEAEVIEVWDRWQAGDANRLIGRDLGRSAGSIRAFVESWGGVRPRVRRRAERHLSLIEREEISRGVAAGGSLRSIGARIGRAPSTISRELARNGGRGRYRAHSAGRAAIRRARRPKPSKLATNPGLRQVVEDLLGLMLSEHFRLGPTGRHQLINRRHPNITSHKRSPGSRHETQGPGPTQPHRSLPS